MTISLLTDVSRSKRMMYLKILRYDQTRFRKRKEENTQNSSDIHSITEKNAPIREKKRIGCHPVWYNCKASLRRQLT